MKRLVSHALVGLVGLVIGAAGSGISYLGTVRARDQAKVALNTVHQTVRLMGRIGVERDSLRRVADSLSATRAPVQSRAVTRIRALGVKPNPRPDTCLVWIERAEQAELAATELEQSLQLADQEIHILRTSAAKADTVFVEVDHTIDVVEPVLTAQSKAGGSFGARLLRGLAPVASVHAGAVAVLDSGQLRIYTGAFGSVGWRINFSLASLFR